MNIHKISRQAGLKKYSVPTWHGVVQIHAAQVLTKSIKTML